jgi:hypothetical protein
VTATRCALLVAVAATAALSMPVAAHPGSGIVADRRGQIYFIDTGAGVWKLDASRALSPVPSPSFHWMTIDADNRFAKARLPSVPNGEITRVGSDPTLLVASDTPIAIGSDGNLYHPKAARGGGVQILRTTPTGQTSVRASAPLPFLNGLAAAADGSLYATGNDTIRRIDAQGRVSLVVTGLSLAGCPAIPGVGASDGPMLRGLDVDARGAIVVAATGCGRVLRVTTDGKVATVIQVESPWSPTAVVHAGADLYVLEYLHTATEDRRAWRPRVRKVSADGQSAVIATVERH